MTLKVSSATGTV